MTYRMLRINELLKQELSQLLETNVDTLGLLSVVAVETTRDLKTATIYIAPFSGEPSQELRKRLERLAYSYRQILLKRLDLKKIPMFTFTFDTHEEVVNRVEALLTQLEQETSQGNEAQ